MFFDNVMDQLLVLFEEKCQYPVGDSGNGDLPAADAPHQGRDTPVYIGIDMKRRGGLTPGYIQKICNESITLFVSKRLLPGYRRFRRDCFRPLRLGRRFGEDGQHRTFGSDYVQYHLLVYASGEYFLFV